MIKHISLRLAWHNNGWNGHICSNPKSNVYCIGQHSYPGDMISGMRDLEWEQKEGVKSCHCNTLDKIPPCAYSINAFGTEEMVAESVPPEFFNDESEKVEFTLPPATACVWPYEVMYGEDVIRPPGSKQTYNYDKRLENSKKYFEGLTPDHTLIFYYANRSNPFSEEDSRNFVLVGISRLKTVGEIIYYKNVGEENRKKYAGGFVWQMPVTSKYPDEGFCIPLNSYLDQPEVLEKIVYVPEVTNNYKYASKQITNDDALIYVEKLIEITTYLQVVVKDTTQDWSQRRDWLLSLLNELWSNRGPYPGLTPVFEYLEFYDLIQYYHENVKMGTGKEAKESIFSFLNDKTIKDIQNSNIDHQLLEGYRRSWHVKLGAQEKRKLIEDLLIRIDITADQIAKILSDRRIENGISSGIEEIIENPFILHEQFVGDDVTDLISFNKIDHAVLPSPELGISPILEKGSWQRLRALMVGELKWNTEHSFISQDSILHTVNEKLSHYPEWKKEVFNAEYITYDQDQFDHALTFRNSHDKVYVYLNQVRQDELTIEHQIRDLLRRNEITFSKPFNRSRWHNELFKPQSPLAKNVEEDYESAIQSQINVCEALIHQPICIISGSAGTGKTTIIKAIIAAINATSRGLEDICLLAPTGKAADRIREKTEANAHTIHRFIANQGWLNPNFTFKDEGGKKEDNYTTYILDESSMIDLALMAALFRSIDWHSVKRLIFVGDPNQIPPIGRGKVFSETIEFIKELNPECIGVLEVNMRQMENQALERGTGILKLANMYIAENIHASSIDGEGIASTFRPKADVESFLKKIQEEGEVDKDLRILSWQDEEDLENKLVELIALDQDRDKIDGNNHHDPMPYQVLSPYRGERFGTENLNMIIQNHFNGYNIENKGNLGGITYFDKIIQVVNRAGRKAYSGYNNSSRTKESVDVFNGEIGKVWIHSFDLKKYHYNNFRLGRFQVRFNRKEQYRIDFSSEHAVSENIELGYTISVHKSQGSEFPRVYLIIPKQKQALLSTELLYTGITRAQRHLTILVESNFTPLISLRRPEKSKLALINSSVFNFKPLSESMLSMRSWYEEGKIHSTLTEFMVRSKSEVIIANMLFEEGIENFQYEQPLFAQDGTFYLPDFTIQWQGKTWYWEHLGMLDKPKYKKHWQEKEAWYKRNYPGQLLTTKESAELSKKAFEVIKTIKNLF